MELRTSIFMFMYVPNEIINIKQYSGYSYDI